MLKLYRRVNKNTIVMTIALFTAVLCAQAKGNSRMFKLDSLYQAEGVGGNNFQRMLSALVNRSPESCLRYTEFKRQDAKQNKFTDRQAYFVHLLEGRAHIQLKQFDESKKSYVAGLAVAEKLEDKTMLSYIHFCLARFHQIRRNDEKGMQHLYWAEYYGERIENPGVVLAKVYHTQARFDREREVYSQSIEYSLKALDVLRNGENNRLRGRIFWTLGNSYFSSKNYEEAYRYYTTAKRIAEENGDSVGIAGVTYNLGLVAFSLSQYDKALRFYTKARRKYENQGNKWGIKAVNCARCELYLEIEDFEKSKLYCQLAVQQVGENVGLMARSILGMARYYNSIEDFEKLAALTDDLVYWLQHEQAGDDRRVINPYVHQFLHETGQPDRAADFLKSMIEERDSLYQLQERLQLLRNNARMDFKVEQKNLVLERAQLQLQAEKKISMGYYMWFMLAILTFLGILILYLWKTNRKKVVLNRMLVNQQQIIRERKFKLEEYNEVLASNRDKLELEVDRKKSLFKEVNHRVKNNLQVVWSLLNLQKHYVREEGAFEIIESCQNRIEVMSGIHKKLYESEDLSAERLREFMMEIFTSTFERKHNLEFTISWSEHSVVSGMEEAITLGLVLNEIISLIEVDASLDYIHLHIACSEHQEKKQIELLLEGGNFDVLTGKAKGVMDIVLNQMNGGLEIEVTDSNQLHVFWELESIRKEERA